MQNIVLLYLNLYLRLYATYPNIIYFKKYFWMLSKYNYQLQI